MTQDQPEFELWLEHEHWEPEDGWDPTDEMINAHITLPDGRSYGLTVCTYRFFERLVEINRRDDDSLGGEYMTPPDLFVRSLERDVMERVVTNMIRLDELRPELLDVNSDDNTD